MSQTAAMSRAVLRHATPLMSIRAPLIAGLGAAVVFAAAVTGVTLFGQGNIEVPFARGDVAPPPAADPHSSASLRDESQSDHNSIRFLEPEDGSEVRLEGVEDGFEANPPPSGATQPNEVETPVAVAVSEPAHPNALPVAPLRGLTEPGPGGPLPIIGADGTRPSRAYARPFRGDPNTPAIAIVIGGMGMDPAVTQAAIDNLPPEVALSFAVYADNLQTWVDRARAAGHEVLIEVPMEPFDYPNSDSGPHTLLADGTAEENERRLTWVLSRSSGYFGVTNYLGARFSASETALTRTLQSLERRGVAFLHDGGGRRRTIEAAASTANIEHAIADRIVDDNPNPNAIDERLLALEALALQNGTALGTGFAYPVTVDQIEFWTNGLETRGYLLAPPSAVMARRRIEARLAQEAQAAAAPSQPRPRPVQRDDHHDNDDDGHH